MNRPVRWIGLSLVITFLPVPAHAQETKPPSIQDMEFLEFLGEWESGEGQWENPLEFLDQYPGDPEATTGDPDLQNIPGTDVLPAQGGKYEGGTIIPFE